MDKINAQNVKVPDVYSLLKKIDKLGQPIEWNSDLIGVTGHVQGVASKNDLVYISQNVTSSINVFSISKEDKGEVDTIKLSTDLLHYGGIQRIGDYLAVPIETQGDQNKRSEIRFIDLTTNKEIPQLCLRRAGFKAGAVGIANYTNNSKEHTMLVVHDNGLLDFYDAESLIDPSTQFNLISKTPFQLKHRGYDNIALVVDLQERIFLLGFWTEKLNKSTASNSAYYPDYIDLLQIDYNSSNINCTMLHEKIRFDTQDIGFGATDPHFRFGGGIEIISKDQVRILASSRLEGYLNVNFFTYFLIEFSVGDDCGKKQGTAINPIGVPPMGQVSINNSSDLSQCIVGNDDAKVFSIQVRRDIGSFYKYSIVVEAQGPKGSGSLHLKFTDATGDTYSLSITDSAKKKHFVGYNSERPSIRIIEWS